MKQLLALLLCLFASCAFARQPSGEGTVTWQLRAPEEIARLGKHMGHGKGVVALAYPFRKPYCTIVTSRPPAHTAAEFVVREYIHTLNHELRHCREGAWHPPNLPEPK